jgi:nitrogen fixation/metabolism regulation signal transduction histidine kinase
LNPGVKLYRSFQQTLVEIQEQSQAKNIFILDNDGRVLIDAKNDYQFRETNWLKDLDPEPFQKAREGQSTASILFPEKDGSIYKIGYSPVRDGAGAVVAVVGVEAGAKFMDGLNEFARILFIFGLLCLALMGGLLYAFGRRFIAPIEELARASQSVSEGDFSQRVQVSANNEIGALAFAFNEMTQRLESHNEYILESMSNGIMVVDLKEKVTTFNKAAASIFGFEQTNVIGRSVQQVFEAFPAFLAVIQPLLAKKESLIDTEIYLSEEPLKIIRIRSAPVAGADAKIIGTEVLFTDETQLRRLESRIKVTEKMATIGELAAGIAHEIRNPLAAMKGFTEILQKRVKDNDSAKEIVTDIASEIEILNKIVTNFLVFAKPTSVEAHEVEVSEVIEGLLPLVKKEAETKKIKVTFNVEKKTFLSLDSEQFRRALLNILLNAVQASPEKSQIQVTQTRFSRKELAAWMKPLEFSPLLLNETVTHWVCVSVRDHGPGFLPENLKKMFTPFFTTKTEGFGLGLSITKKILEAHGGDVGAANHPEGGALFALLLPIVSKDR